jgi:hypothetical protein
MSTKSAAPPSPGASTLPARWPPLLYFGFAHLCLAAALAVAALDPHGVGGFFYHPRMLAVVHLVTLGWISSSILGAIYIVGPLAFRMPLPARPADYAGFSGFVVGVIGMISHFWIDSPAGMVWSAALVGLSFVYVAGRALTGLRTAPVAFEVRLPMALAFVNVIGAAALGVLLGINKASPFLKVRHLDVVFAHAHLAGLGWGVLMVVGAGYRMLPMILPAAMPRGPWVYASGLLIEAGLIGLVWSFLNQGRGLEVSAVIAAAGIGAFLSCVGWMLRNRRPAPGQLVRPDWGAWHILQALAWLAIASALGLYLSFSVASESGLRVAMAYGVAALLGFLSQMVVGVETRILPLFAWLWGFADRAYVEQPPPLHGAAVRSLQALTFCLWTGGVPVLAGGLAFDRAAMVSTGAAGLLGAVLVSVVNAAVVLTRLWHRGNRG